MIVTKELLILTLDEAKKLRDGIVDLSYGKPAKGSKQHYLRLRKLEIKEIVEAIYDMELR